MLYQLPPVGNPVALRAGELPLAKSGDDSIAEVFDGWQVRFYDSGTASLAAAMLAAKKNSVVSAQLAEVILPAYGCPDLVAAALYAGLKPILVDLETSKPWLSLTGVRDAISENTVAIVAVNLFGINERLQALREIIKTGVAGSEQICLIEDSAQGFPAYQQSLDAAPCWQGDLVVLSFGRGKPLSLMGGGAVLAARDKPALAARLPAINEQAAGLKQRVLYRLKAGLYNAMIHPRLYWIPQALPFLHLGETRYHALDNIEAMDAVRRSLLQQNLAAYYRYDRHVKSLNKQFRQVLATAAGVIDLAASCDMPVVQRLLRYPVLLPAEQRQSVFQCLRQSGLGPSLMYPAAMPYIEGLQSVWPEPLTCPNAEDFAARILTLPTHGRISSGHLASMARCITCSAGAA